MLCPRRQGKFDEGEERRGKEMKREERQKGGKEKTVTNLSLGGFNYYFLINVMSKEAETDKE